MNQEKRDAWKDKAADTAGNIVEKAKNAVSHSKDAVVHAIDQNGNGEIDIEDIIIASLHVPGIMINREKFLRREFFKNHTQEAIDDAVLNTPAHAGISQNEIDGIADAVIQYERNCVSGISAALGAPGGVAMVATLPADIVQYYGYMIRAAQKLMYLYGFPQININEDGQKFDTETINILTLCLGAMYGVAGANHALKWMAEGLAKGVEKKLLNKALTKGVVYPIVKKIAWWFGVRMNKQIFAGFFRQAIPVVGGVLGGGITYATFKPCCDKLKVSLQNTMLSNPDQAEAVGDLESILDTEIVEADLIQP